MSNAHRTHVTSRLLSVVALLLALFAPTALAAPAQAAGETGATVTVSQTEIVGDEEVVVTVNGTGFDPDLGTGTRPPLAGKAAGSYVVFGAFEDNWKPSEGNGSSTRPVNAGQKWAVLAEDMGSIGGAAAGAIELTAEGSFTAELTVSKALLDDKLGDNSLDDLNVGIYTYAGSGASVAAYESFTTITFTEATGGEDDDQGGDQGGDEGGDDSPPVADPSVTASQTEFIGDEEVVVTVEGTGFDPDLATGSRPPLMGKAAGSYVVFGAFAEEWKPSEGNGSGTRPVNAGQKWAVLAEDMGSIGGAAAGAIELSPDGSFTAELTVSKPLLDAELGDNSLDDLNVGIYTYAGSGASVAAYETFTPITFTTPDPSVTVSKTTFIGEEEAVVTIEGKSFDPDLATGSRPPLMGKAAGTYVVFGAFADNWKPSEGNGSGTRPVNAGQKWAVLAEDMAGIGGAAAGAIELTAEGSFTAELTVSKALLDDKLGDNSLDDLNVGIYTYAGSGASVAAYETFTPITFESPSVTVSQTEFVDGHEAVVRVEGKNFLPALGTGTRPPLMGKAAGSYVVFGAFEDDWKPSEGNGSGTRPVNAGQKWAVLAEDMGSIGGVNAGAIELSPDGSFTAELTVSKALLEDKLGDNSLDDLNVGIYTYAGSGASVAAYETFTPITFTAAATPTVTVSKTEFVGDEEAVVRVEGRNFDPLLGTGTRPPLMGKAAGSYVVFGAFEDNWKPSEGNGSSARPVNAGQKWAVLAEDMGSIGGVNAGAIELSPDGSFTADLAVSKALLEDKLGDNSLDDLNVGIYTYAGSGANVAAYETFTPITFTEDSGKAKVNVSKTDFDGDKEYQITVKGTGFDPALATGTRPPLAGKPGGSYVVFGAFEDDWKPSEGNGSSARPVNAGQKWAVLAEDMAGIGGVAAGAIELTPEGTFEAKLTVSKAKIEANLGENSIDDLNVGIYTYAGSGANVAAYETFTPLSFDGEYTNPPKPTNPTTPGSDKTKAGSLSWGISTNWITYVNNSVPDGKVSTAGGVTRSGNNFIFGQKSTTAKPPSAVGTTTYRGSVNVYGHSGFMDVTLNEPAIRVIDGSRAVLSARVAGKGRVRVANLNLAAGSKSTGNGTVTYSSVPATLTARGASDVFEGFYQAGHALDRVTFTIGENAKASNATSSTASAAADKDWTPPAEPPATEGLDISADEVKVGETITASANGFVPGEKNIKVVVYSEPVVLSQDVQADASGRASWTGQIPGLEPGEHTLTFQGSQNVGAVFTVVEEEIVGKCEVTDATLNWGLKEQFRSYVSGMIARGDWKAYDGAEYETPEFIWPNGDGSVDTKQGQINFEGSVDFNGHGGALDMTIDDPKIVFEGSDNATLVLDYAASDISDAIAGKGVKTASPQTPFVSMELSAAKRTVDDNTVTLENIPTRLLGPGAALLTQYGEGERFDDATLVYTLAEGCDPDAVVSEKATSSISKEVFDAQGGVPVFWIAGGTIAALLALIAGIVWAVRRRKVGA